MNLTSLKSYLRIERPRAPDYVRFLHILLNGIALHAVENKAGELGSFRHALDHICRGITNESSVDEIVEKIHAALRALDEYNGGVSGGLRAYSEELKGILTIMAETIAFLSTSSQTGVQSLQDIEKNLAGASEANDVKLLRAKISDCLHLVRSETGRLRKDSQARIESLKSSMSRATKNLQKAPNPPEWPQAGPTPIPRAGEQEIARRLAEGKDFALALLAADRITSITARYGRSVANKALMLIAQQLAEKMAGVGQLVPWNGSSFIVLVEIQGEMGEIERQVQEIAGTRIEMSMDFGNRHTVVPLTCSSVIHRITPAMQIDEIVEKLESSLTMHSSSVA